MATITNIQGMEIYFDPANVCAVADRDETGQPATTIYGVLKIPVTVAEAVPEFLARLGIAAEFAELTRPDGSRILLRATAVDLMLSPVPGNFPTTVHSVATAGDLTQAVTEDLATAAATLRAHGSKI